MEPPPQGGGRLSQREGEPTGLCLRRVTRLPPAALSAPAGRATGYLGAQALGALSQLPNSAARPRAPSLTGHSARTSSSRSPWAPAAPRGGPSGTRCPALGCCVGRSRPSCVRKHASAARKLLETQRRLAWPVTRGVGRWGGAGECCCRGCREMGAEPAILGLHQDDVIPSWDLEDRGGLHPGV